MEVLSYLTKIVNFKNM